MIERAIISVFDKTGLNKLVNELVKWNVEIISTSGTADIIKKMGHNVINISNHTTMPEMPGGLFKTLHPMIHVGIIGNLKDPKHKEFMEKHKIKKIDLVVVNFFPFKETIKTGEFKISRAAAHVDLGGVALARTAAKASFLYGRVTLLTSPIQYDLFLNEISKNNGDTSHRYKLSNAIFAFEQTSYYDKVIRERFSEVLI